ncbi:acetyl-CoA carboxylase biotin carboxylase subunit [Benzoatithermus flavus]|uniref:propionyl-CoA carboxylase n=1 Tax=Benzoatithermus flavus TaxID=3108223 RepID=A0ABU8XWI1_9PROT
MFKKLLIANRGEIACRIIRSCRKLGIGTVAVYSEADADALHVQLADETVFLGPPPAAQSYLLIDRIVAACKATGAEAVHPGYGFLSERAAFARALEEEGIVFVGPPVGAIEAMGDKIESKRLAREARVSTVPGTLDAISDPAEALRIAREIGYPVMVKASAGGGGKGMRIAHDEQELVDGLERARSEARSSFGDDRVFIEKYVVEPRHIEIQVLGDRYGNVVYLGERECSIQRRHQKVIEEAPSPFLDEATRRAMGEQAVALAKAVGYHSAGTVEFIVDKDRNFYFLEMNTRLQVEHPVTELVTGLDLVELMIKVAAGEKLPFTQADVKLEGWAIEARVYAEDPKRGFLPSTGRLVRYIEPVGEGIRVDSGVVEGGEVSMFYDPMIAKLCAYGPDRAAATRRLSRALDAFVIRGLGHNIPFLNAVLANPRFQQGRLSTNFIAEEYGERFQGSELPEGRRHELAAMAVVMKVREVARAAEISGRMRTWRYQPVTAWSVQLDKETFPVEVESHGQDGLSVTIGGHKLHVALEWRPGQPLARATIDGRWIVAQVDPILEGYILTHGGAELTALVRTRKAAEYAARMPEKTPPDTSRLVKSPMPGLIVSVAVAEGQEVKAGQELCILEAMKMENVLRAERDGIVSEVRIKARDTVAADQVLMTFG